MPEHYQKPALTFSQQLSLLQQRGLVVSDKASALRQLSAISYYRLSAYWYPFRQRDGTGNILSNFVPDTEFNRITNLYEFDRKLRLLVMDALERVEVAVRTQITYFQIHHKRLGDWLHTLAYVRNVCAHHSRLWNRELAIRPDNSKLPEWRAPWTPRNDRIFYILLILRHLLRASGNGDEWACAVSQVMEPFADCDAQRYAMGMPENWKEHPVWK